MISESLLKLAEAGDVEAQVKVAVQSYRGVELLHGKRLGVEIENALRWFKIAAEKDHKIALYYLGRMHEQGEGVSRDLDKSLNYYVRSSDAGFGPASVHLGFFYDRGEIVKRDLNTAFEYFLTAINQGETKANYYIGKYLLYGQTSIERNIEEGMRHFEVAADEGFALAQYELGMLHIDGFKVLQNYERGIYWLTEAAKNDYQRAHVKLAHHYYNGVGVSVDKKIAYSYWRRAAEPLNGSRPSTEALLNCGVCHFNGMGSDDDDYWAEVYFLKAAKLRVTQAQYSLAVLYKRKSLRVESHAWFNIASVSGHEQSIAERSNLEKEMSNSQIAEAQKLAEGILNNDLKNNGG